MYTLFTPQVASSPHYTGDNIALVDEVAAERGGAGTGSGIANTGQRFLLTWGIH